MISARGYRWKRRIDRALRPGARAVVLLYHRIAEDPSDPYGLCVSPAHFEEHLQVLRESGRPMPLVDMARSIVHGSLPDRAICVTFDDGYLDNLLHGYPLLERYDVAATVFVTTGPGGRVREFWWDELERVFLRSPRLPDRLELPIDGRTVAWTLGEAAPDVGQDAGELPLPHRGWHLGDREAPTLRHAVFREVYHVLRPMTVQARAEALDQLLAWAGDRADNVRPTRRAMSAEQVAGVSRGGLVQIGAHTVNHLDLPAQPAAVQRREVESSKTEVESWIGHPVSGFAYPYGAYGEDSVEAVRQAGFEFACSGEHHLVHRRSSRLLLPRVEVPAAGGDALAERLRGVLW